MAGGPPAGPPHAVRRPSRGGGGSRSTTEALGGRGVPARPGPRRWRTRPTWGRAGPAVEDALRAGSAVAVEPRRARRRTQGWEVVRSARSRCPGAARPLAGRSPTTTWPGSPPPSAPWRWWGRAWPSPRWSRAARPGDRGRPERPQHVGRQGRVRLAQPAPLRPRSASRPTTWSSAALADADLVVTAGPRPRASWRAWEPAKALALAPAQLGPVAEAMGRRRAAEPVVPPLRHGLAAVTQEGWAIDAAPSRQPGHPHLRPGGGRRRAGGRRPGHRPATGWPARSPPRRWAGRSSPPVPAPTAWPPPAWRSPAPLAGPPGAGGDRRDRGRRRGGRPHRRRLSRRRPPGASRAVRWSGGRRRPRPRRRRPRRPAGRPGGRDPHDGRPRRPGHRPGSSTAWSRSPARWWPGTGRHRTDRPADDDGGGR